jgi:hypothetical protein
VDTAVVLTNHTPSDTHHFKQEAIMNTNRFEQFPPLTPQQEADKARYETEARQHRRELVVKANMELRAHGLADKYGLNADDMLMHLRERFLGVVEDVEVSIQTEGLQGEEDTVRTELRAWLQINEDARTLARRWGLDSARVLTALIRTSGTGMFCAGDCCDAGVSYSPCLRTALERAHELALFTPEKVLYYFEEFLTQAFFPPHETEDDPMVLPVIAFLTGRLDKVLLPLLSRLTAAAPEEAETKPAEQEA